jgi:uncharacterized protein YbjT (DUF2867 family)
MPSPSETAPVLVVGATGYLGGQVVKELLARGKQVRALVRASTSAAELENLGVEIARGDMLEPDSLASAMKGVDAVVSTAAGYTRRQKNAQAIDTTGYANLAQAARAAGVRRFVLTSILTADQTPGVSHFWHKKLAEDNLRALGVPFVALRPGAFLDQITTRPGNVLEKGQVMWIGSKDIPLTFVLTSDLAGYLADAVDADIRNGERIDIGWDRPESISGIAALLARATGRTIKVRAVPSLFPRLARAIPGSFAAPIKDMAGMFLWFNSGKYVADTTRQREVFGAPPTADQAVDRLVQQLRG